MKYTILIFTVICWICFINAQQTFAPLGAKWYYSSASQGIAPPDAAYWLYESKKDTIINGISCQKISTSKINYLGNQISGTSLLVYTTNDTVLYFNNYVKKFVPLYIFNVQVNDTLTFYKPDNKDLSSDSTFRVVVDSISFLAINNHSLRRIYIKSIDFYEFGNCFTERIGSDFGLLPEYYTSIPEKEVGALRCYSDSSISTNFTSYACDYRVSVNIESTREDNIVGILPNPIFSFAYIECKHSKLSQINICDIRGQQQKVECINTLIGYRIDMSNFSPGLYFFHIQLLSGERYIRKVLKE
ncbi:MAG: hypothetical protein KF706_10230 [Chitinophagales bacterium]|nr:hypothetical protein [Chitinophagales bacterium]